jgi:2-hydroxycyclohexanecarboxyl-CoA dehydrogenase
VTGGDDKGVALVTGAASGIGAAVAGRLLAGGWLVAGIDLEPSETTFTIQVDVADRSAVRGAVDRVAGQLGPVRALVTAAGVYEMVPFEQIDEAAWRRTLAVNLGGTVNACWAVLPGMLAQGSSVIVTISSELALAGGTDDAHYVAAKGAILGFARSLGVELAPRGIRVNTVAPGPTDTPLLEPDSPWREEGYLQTLPLGRMVTPDEVAETVEFVIEEGTYFAGQTISPNAGAVI